MIPNPYVILGAVVGAILLAVGCFFEGEHIDSLAWTKKIDAQKIEASNLLAAQTAKVNAAEQAQADLNAKLEDANAKAILAAADKDDAVRAALDAARVRIDAGRGPGCPRSMPSAKTASGAPDVAIRSSNGLASAMDDLIARTARAANDLASYARECNAFALSLKP